MKDYTKLPKGDIIDIFGFDPYLLNDFQEMTQYDKEKVVLVDFSEYVTVEITEDWLKNKRHKKIKKAFKDNYLEGVDGVILRAKAELKKQQDFKKAVEIW